MPPGPWGAAFLAALTLVGFVPAQRVATTQITPTSAPVAAGFCPQWHDLAIAVGWPEDEWSTVDYVMHRESRCNEGAVGTIAVRGKRALGLMQLLGWSCPPGGCLDAASNLTRALDLWRSSGWRPWCLRGDPVTGTC